MSSMLIEKYKRQQQERRRWSRLKRERSPGLGGRVIGKGYFNNPRYVGGWPGATHHVWDLSPLGFCKAHAMGGIGHETTQMMWKNVEVKLFIYAVVRGYNPKISGPRRQIS
jgi:hypothetical protein